MNIIRPVAYKMPAMVGRPLEEAIILIEGSHLQPGNIQSVSIGIKANWFGFSTDLYEGFVGPGQEIWVLIPKNQDVWVSLYKNGEPVENLFFPAWQSQAN